MAGRVHRGRQSWEKSDDGSNWTKDFDLTYVRVV
jgi:hypothetical protein